MLGRRHILMHQGKLALVLGPAVERELVCNAQLTLWRVVRGGLVLFPREA